MEKIILEKTVKGNIDNNFDRFSKYLDFDYQVFNELKHSSDEVVKCLILEFDKAAITLTNNILIRLLKLSLIYNEMGIKSVPIEKWNSFFNEPNRKYGSLPLGKLIELCHKQDLITKSEKDYLTDSVNKLIINGYSSADTSKMLEIATDERFESQRDHEDSPGLDRSVLKHKIIPPLQSIQIENFTKANASIYFEFVFELIGNIEKRLIEKGR